jgi:hypothetical protein
MNRKLMFAIAWLVILTSTTALASGVQPTTTELITQGSQQVIESKFLTRNGSRVLLNGEEFRAIGANHADLIRYFLDSNSTSDENGTEVIEEAAKWNITALRFPAIGYGPNSTHFIELWKSDNEEFWKRYDNLVGNASQNRVYLLPVLVWTTYFYEPYSYVTRHYIPESNSTETLEAIRQLFNTGSDVNQQFKNFTSDLIKHYGNNTTILMWEIGNELNLSCDRGEENYTTVATLQDFLSNSTDNIHSLDSNHLVGSGMAAPAWPDQGENLTSALGNFTFFNQFVDVTSIHTYQHMNASDRQMCGERYGISEAEYIDAFLNASKNELNKPMIIGEFGEQGDSSTPDDSQFIPEVLEAMDQSGVPVSLIWEWMVPNGTWIGSDRRSWNVNPTDTPRITQMLKEYSLIPEYPSILITSLFMIATLLAIILHKRRMLTHP